MCVFVYYFDFWNYLVLWCKIKMQQLISHSFWVFIMMETDVLKLRYFLLLYMSQPTQCVFMLKTREQLRRFTGKTWLIYSHVTTLQLQPGWPCTDALRWVLVQARKPISAVSDDATIKPKTSSTWRILYTQHRNMVGA